MPLAIETQHPLDHLGSPAAQHLLQVHMLLQGLAQRQAGIERPTEQLLGFLAEQPDGLRIGQGQVALEVDGVEAIGAGIEPALQQRLPVWLRRHCSQIELAPQTLQLVAQLLVLRLELGARLRTQWHHGVTQTPAHGLRTAVPPGGQPPWGRSTWQITAPGWAPCRREACSAKQRVVVAVSMPYCMAKRCCLPASTSRTPAKAWSAQ